VLFAFALGRRARSRRRALRVLATAGSFAALSLTSCDYVRLLRPSVRKQLRPPMVHRPWLQHWTSIE